MKKSALLSLIIFVLACGIGFAQTTEFTYQGSLQNGGTPAVGSYDFEFLLYDALSGGTQLGPTVTRSSVAVAAGIFTVNLDFGGQFPGAGRFLEIHVRQTGGGAFTPLTPRHSVNSSPYSIKSLNTDQLGGVAANQYVLTSASVVNAATQYNISGGRVLSLGVGNFGITSIFAGWGAGANTTGATNSFFGANAGFSNITGNGNSFFGYAVGFDNTGSDNSFFGISAGQANTTGGNNSFFGRIAGQANTTGGNNTIIGAGANTGSGALTFATALGAGATVNASNTLVLGRNLDTVQIPGIINSATQYNIGGSRILSNPGSGNLFAGVNAGTSQTSGFTNSFFGAQSGQSNTTGGANSFFGFGAGQSNTASFNNSFFGTTSGQSNTNGQDNSFFGAYSGGVNTDGTVNSFFGSLAGGVNTSGSLNSFFGMQAGNFNTTGGANSFFGYQAGSSNTIGSNNTVIGSGANVGAANLTNATAIGAGAQVSQSNSLVLGNNARVGIGTSLPTYKLEINELADKGLRVATGTFGGTVASFGGRGAFVIDAEGVAGGRLKITESGLVSIPVPSGLVIRSPDNACWAVNVSNAGALSTTSVPCP